MLVRDLAERVPVVSRTTTALEAARLIASLRLAGLVVVDDAGLPVAVLPATQVLGLVVPRYVRDNPALARVYDERGSDEVFAKLSERTLAELLDDRTIERRELPRVQADDTLVEVAAVMVREHSPVVLVDGRDGDEPNVVTLARVLAAVLAAADGLTPATERTLSDDLLDLHEQLPGA